MLLAGMPYPAAAAAGAFFVGAKTYTNNATTDQAVSLTDLKDESNANAVLEEGDIIVVTYVIAANLGTKIATSMFPTGYKPLRSAAFANDSGSANMQASYRIMGVTPDTTVTIPAAPLSTQSQAVHIVALRNIDLTIPFDILPEVNTAIDSGRPNPPALTANTAGALITVHGGAADNPGAVVAFVQGGDLDSATNHFLSAAKDSSQDAVVGVGLKSDYTSGAFDPAAWAGGTAGSTASNIGMTVAWRPASSPPTVLGTSAPTIHATGAQANVTAGNPSIAWPTTTSSGTYYALMQVVYRGAPLSSGFSINTPAGWTLLAQVTTADDGLCLAWFGKDITGTETGTVAITCTGTGVGRGGGVIHRLSGLKTSGTRMQNFVSHAAISGSNTNNKVEGDDLAIMRNGSLIISTQLTGSGIAGFTADAAWTDVFDAQIAGSGPDYVWQCTSKAAATPEIVLSSKNTPSANVGYLSFTAEFLSPDV